MSFAGKTVFITGSSRGIGKAVAVAYGRAGANVIITGKTTSPHKVLSGTIHDAAEEVIKAGGDAVAIQMDIRDENAVAAAVKQGVQHFSSKGNNSKLDILINNASAINLTNTSDTPMKRYDLMNQVNARGTYCATQACLPYLEGAPNPHVVTYSPPLVMNPNWFKDFCAYSISKFGMSMCALGMAEEFKPKGIAVNTLWPRTVIATEALRMIGGDAMDEMMKQCRTPEIMADATLAITSKSSKEYTGKFLIDEEVLKEIGVTDLSKYAYVKGTTNFLTDLFVPENETFQNSYVSSPAAPQETPVSSDDPTNLNYIYSRMNEAAVSDDFLHIKMTAQFKINHSDNNCEYWFINFPEKKITKHTEKQQATVTTEMDPLTVYKLLSGSLDPMMGYLMGNIKIEGKMSHANKLISVIHTFSQKYKL